MTPKDEGFLFPAEWFPHKGTWLAFPHNEETWGNRLHKIYPSYLKFMKQIAKYEEVNLIVSNGHIKNIAKELCRSYNLNNQNIKFHEYKTNDNWCRDYGPSFLINPSQSEKAIINWAYNAWGEKYIPFEDDNAIPKKIAQANNLRVFEPGIIMEGGSIDLNGKGTLITSKSCLLNKNRNPDLNQKQIEEKLIHYYNVEKILWLNEGIVGDDTDGHVDDMCRFINENTVVAVTEKNRLDSNYSILKNNLKDLQRMKMADDKKLNIIELPMPKPLYSDGIRLPASYANFYICNKQVIVPTFNCKEDESALRILQKCFKGREITGIDSSEIIWGLGSFHCMSQQEPELRGY